MEDPTEYLISNIKNYFVSTTNLSKSTRLIKFHTEKLNSLGDVSFTTNSDIWYQNFGIRLPAIGTQINSIFLKDSLNLEDESAKFIKHCESWQFPVKNVKIIKDRCALYFEKTNVINYIFQEILVGRKFGTKFTFSGKRLTFDEASNRKENNLCFHRAELAREIMENIWSLVDPINTEESRKIYISSVASNEFIGKKYVTKLGLVLDPIDSKMIKMSTQEYTSLRSTDMRLIAMHKYGLRVKDRDRFIELIQNLGKAAVKVDLMEVKSSSPVKIIRNGQGSSKGASFILYNSARIETLIRTFEDRVKSGDYPTLPEPKDIDITVLNEEEEWQLIYGYIFQYPRLIYDCLYEMEKGQFSAHTIVQYLNGLVSVFSVYYRRIRILMQNRSHLLPSVFARIYLVQCIRYILNSCLRLLNIQPVQYM